jgi:GDP-mannose 6-dehydrogenase
MKPALAPSIGIFGLGYVGLTTAACLISKGYRVRGYDISQEKLDLLADGQVPITEPGVSDVLQPRLASKEFVCAKEPDPSDSDDICLVCVGTPSLPDGSSDLQALRSVFTSLERLCSMSAAPSTMEVVVRSTLPPGTLKQMASDYPGLFTTSTVCIYPEFLREGCAMNDFFDPPQTIVGLTDEGREPVKLLQLLHAFGFAPQMVPSGVAEMVKAASNAFHALKVTFANEIGRIAEAHAVDGTRVMQLLINDTKLNVSPAYLRPGTPYGGSCLPKDTRMLDAQGRHLGLGTELFAACERSNQAHIDYIASRILRIQPKRIAVLGLAFKENTDDLRESPSLALVDILASRRGIEVRVHDSVAAPHRLIGLNRRFFEIHGHNPNLLFTSDLAAAMENADVIVVMQRSDLYPQAIAASTVPVIDWAGWSFELPSK